MYGIKNSELQYKQLFPMYKFSSPLKKWNSFRERNLKLRYVTSKKLFLYDIVRYLTSMLVYLVRETVKRANFSIQSTRNEKFESASFRCSLSSCKSFVSFWVFSYVV